MSQIKLVPRDSYLFREGDPPDAMYIVKSGHLAITKSKGPNSEVSLAELKAGAMVGEMALFDRKPRSANVKALKDSEVVALPYDALEKQMESVPTWMKAILKTMNENLREANRKIKTLESSAGEGERFPPHTVNKLISIINLITARYGQKEPGAEGLLVPPNRLRNYTIQIFQEATNKMEGMQQALKDLGFFAIEDLGESKRKITNLKSDFLFDFVDWYNDWLFKQDKDKIPVSAEEVRPLEALAHFARKVQPDSKGARKVSLSEMQNDSMKELGNLVRAEDLNSLIEKGFASEKTMEEGGLFVRVQLENVEKPAMFWKFIWDLKKVLR